MHETIRDETCRSDRIKSGNYTASRRQARLRRAQACRGKWTAVVCLAVEIEEPADYGHMLGFDRNCGQVADSDGELHEMPDMSRLEGRARRLQRKLSRQEQRSKRRERTKRHLAKTRRRIANRRRRGQGKPQTFGFLGMTHFCDQSRNDRFRVGRMPSRKRVNRTFRRIKEELRRRRRDDRNETAAWLVRVMNGWLNHYAVPGSGRCLGRFMRLCQRVLWRALRRRSRRDRTAWEKIDLLAAIHWPKARIRHPWPDQRLVVNTQGRSPVR
ncbi:MAG: hypothetical protein F4186_11620 [Boseongicola sp. SB0676_bin_33]|nr:hypothetical protein [Boseongicola sp. SB0676_bin_33]MYK32675.1 hypothetical protein [Boseongicola sp. SB0670_bin_30]